MRYVIHGEDLISSRNYLRNLKKNYQNVVSLAGEKLSLQEFNEKVFNQNLFPGKTLILVENFSGRIPFPTNSSTDIVFWWPKTILDLPDADKILHFKDNFSYGIFKFADSVGQRQANTSMVLLNRLLEERSPPEKIIAILSRQLKLIAQVLDGRADKVSTSSFVRKKLIDQSKFWNLKKIQEGFTLLFQTDLKIKKGVVKPEAALTFMIFHLCRY